MVYRFYLATFIILQQADRDDDLRREKKWIKRKMVNQPAKYECIRKRFAIELIKNIFADINAKSKLDDRDEKKKLNLIEICW